MNLEQLELAVNVAMSQNDRDFYGNVAAFYFRVPYAEVSEEQRAAVEAGCRRLVKHAPTEPPPETFGDALARELERLERYGR